MLFARLHYISAAFMIANAGGNGWWLLAEAYKMLQGSSDQKVLKVAERLKSIRDEALSQAVQQSVIALVFGSWTFLRKFSRIRTANGRNCPCLFCLCQRLQSLLKSFDYKSVRLHIPTPGRVGQRSLPANVGDVLP